MKTFTRYIKHALYASMIVFLSCQMSCSSGSRSEGDVQVVMPQSYPKTAVEPYKLLASSIPADSDFLFISSYGALADAILQVKDWQVVDSDELQKLLDDLGTHYLLNPAKLKTYFEAGMNVESGFAAGIKQKTPYLILDIYDRDLFRKWFDNFLNEEFGRPRYHELLEGKAKITQIHILNRDFATLVEEPGKPVIITFGSGMIKGASPSLDAYHALVEGAHMTDNVQAHEKFIDELRDAPMTVWLKSDGNQLKSVDLPDDLAELYPWSPGVGLALYFGTAGPKVRAFCTWRERQYKGMPLGQWMAGLAQGMSSDWAKSILKTKSSSMMRVLLDAEQLEPMVLAMLTDKQQNMYADLKDKLTQRFLKLNISEQVIYNISSAWLILYEANATAVKEASLMEMLLTQDAAIFIPMRDAAESDSFFAKVNILKGFIPKDLGTVELEGDILHARLQLADGVPAHVAYSRGMIAISTEKAWSRVLDVFAAADAPANDSLFALDSHFFAMNLQMSDVTTILGTRFGIIREQIGQFLKPFERIEAQASVNATSMEVIVEAPLSKSAASAH